MAFISNVFRKYKCIAQLSLESADEFVNKLYNTGAVEYKDLVGLFETHFNSFKDAYREVHN